jgi:DNA-methyltransferase (dcm)
MFVKNAKLCFIDLFAGAGGLSEGFIQSGFNPVAHIEMNAMACSTLETRSCYYYLKSERKLGIYYNYLRGNITRTEFLNYIPENVLKTIMCVEMSERTITGIFDRIDEVMNEDGTTQIDVVVGGPPCQAYSLVGRAQSSHMGTPMEQDPRNNLYLLYSRFLKRYKPTMFVFENVMGIESANRGQTWASIQAELKRAGYDIECHEQNARDFGVMQNRRRMIIIGWKRGSGLHYPKFKPVKINETVNQLLQDLPKMPPGQERHQYRTACFSKYVRENAIRTADDVLTLHQSRPHIERDIKIYKKAIELWENGHQRLNYNHLPDELKTHRNRTSFVDRFKVVEGDLDSCHTILAHLSKDGHYFIHPDINQHRSITVREAARIQSFPDNYFFEGARTAQFVQVGNAVPPLMAKAIAAEIYKQLCKEDNNA